MLQFQANSIQVWSAANLALGNIAVPQQCYSISLQAQFDASPFVARHIYAIVCFHLRKLRVGCIYLQRFDRIFNIQQASQWIILPSLALEEPCLELSHNRWSFDSSVSERCPFRLEIHGTIQYGLQGTGFPCTRCVSHTGYSVLRNVI